MSSIISGVAAVLVLLPFLGYFAAFIVMKQISGNHRKAVNTAVDITTFLLLFSVHFIIVAIWDKSFLWLLILVLLIGTGLLSVIHWKVKEEIVFRNILKGGWRLGFLLFSTAYLFLLFYGVAARIAGTF
ncbi:DUF3397 domain-containing protein [Bacillus sp. SCS-153A]|uniref:DUF3397 domain-containing protein n=1 Tax=Rossellomorea sedimentorum TaxID=3115294 RepID=UPI003905DEDB